MLNNLIKISVKELSINKYPVILIVLTPLILQLPIIFDIVDFFSGEASDLVPYFYGTKSLIYQTFQKNGEIALWNPHIMFGQPVTGNIQYALFYPLNWIFLFVSFFKALPYYQMIHFLIAGLGAYLLSQYMGCKKSGSTLASLLLMLNGKIIYYINAGWLSYFSSICWLPFFILFSLKIVNQKTLYNPIFLGVSFGMSFLSGTPQYAFLGFYLLIITGIFQFFHKKSKSDRIHLLYRIALTGLISFLLISIQLFPAIEQTFLSTRPRIENQAIGFYFHWDLKEWFRILVRPELLRHDFTWELCAYIGIGGLVLSFIGLIFSRKNILLICIWGIIPFLLSMGPEISILSEFTRHTPGISMLTNPSRYFIFTIIILTVLSGHGLDYILDTNNKRRRIILILTITCLVLLTASIVLKPYQQITIDEYIWYFSTIVIFFTLSVCYLRWKSKIYLYLLFFVLILDPLHVSMDILLHDKYHIKDFEPPSKIINAIKNCPKHPRIASIQTRDAWNNNLLTPFDDWICITSKIDRASGYEPLGMRKSHLFAAKMDGTGSLIKSLWGYRLWAFQNHRLFNLAGITHLITSEPIDDPGLKLAASDNITMPNYHGGWWKEKQLYLYENINSYPRAFLMDNHKDFKITPVKITTISPNTRQLYFKTDTPKLLVISESFHPGWVARNLDTELQIKRFLDNFISIKVRPGEYNIQLEFKPHSLYMGSLFSMTGILLIFLFILYQYNLDRKKRMAPYS